jgi:tripeptidyl-peptidase-1
MLLSIYLTATIAVGLTIANPISGNANLSLKKRVIPATHNLHERHLPHWSCQWIKKDKVPAYNVLPMRIGIKQTNIQAGATRLQDT